MLPVSDSEDASGRAALVAALKVRTHLKRGLAVGLLVSISVYLLFVVAPPGTVRSQLYYLSLAVVLALTVAGATTAILVARTAARLANEE